MSEQIKVSGYHIADVCTGSDGVDSQQWNIEGDLHFEDKSEMYAFETRLRMMFKHICNGKLHIYTYEEFEKFKDDMDGNKQPQLIGGIVEFKTVGEAYEYCKENGFDVNMVNPKIFDIANAIYQVKVKQDKITRHACAENIKKLPKAGGKDDHIIIRSEAMLACIKSESV
jgi:hypothetical protein